MRFLATALVLCTSVAALAQSRPATQTSKVSFRDDGITILNGKPFFPIGIWVYEINNDVLADIHEHAFNTVIGNGFSPAHLDEFQKRGLMGVPIVSEEFLAKGITHPALLCWYLSDEPEGRKTPAEIRTAYEQLKAKDPNHPIGLDHYLFEGLTQYKDGCDFSMSDVYPILAKRDGIITNVGLYLDQARRIHGPGWPHWVFIQIFGGPDSDGGKWAQPLPQEVRCMTFIALIHRAGAINYFSYWPKAPTTWNAVSKLNRDLHRLTPWLLAEGPDAKASTNNPLVQVRARKIGESWMVIAVNTDKKFHEAAIAVEGLTANELPLAFEHRTVPVKDGKWNERFAPFEERVYLSGSEPGHEN